MTFDDFKSGIELIQYLAIAGASCTAIWGVNSWRSEAKWKRKFELGEEVLTLFYEMQDVMNDLRHPYSYIGELPDEDNNQQFVDDPKNSIRQIQLMKVRYEKHKASFAKLKAMKYRFMTVFGNEAKIPFEKMDEIVGELFSASYRLEKIYWKKLSSKNISGNEFQYFIKQMHKYEGLIWNTFDETDIVNSRLKGIIEMVEQYVGPVLQKK